MVRKKVGIIGQPISHSISPVFQQAAFDYCSIDAQYEAWEVVPGDLQAFAKTLRSSDFLGCNVTVPHKEAAIGYLDQVDEWAARAGAVNTIVNYGNSLKGYNTDGQGFLRALSEQWHHSTKECNVLVLGAGGAAKAVCLALADQGVRSITIANRALDRAQKLVNLIKERCPVVGAVPLAGKALKQASMNSQLVVNCTILGMSNGPAEGQTPLSSKEIPSDALVYDLVYNPTMTPLLKEAIYAGADTLGGLPMLVFQGAASFELWTGIKAPLDIMRKAAEKAINKATNLS